MKVLVGGPFNKGKFLVGASSWHCETSRRFVDRRSAGRGAGECVISSCVLLAAVSLLSRSVGPQPPPRQHGGRGRGPTRALSPAGGGYHSTTYTLTTWYTNQDQSWIMMFAGRLPGRGGREGGRRRGVCCLLDLRWVVVRCQLVAADWNQGIRGQARDLGIPTK